MYLENSNDAERSIQSAVGDTPQQVLKFLWNVYIPGSTTQIEAFIEDIRLGPKEWDYFKLSRSQGIGAIKPEVALYLHSLEMVYDPYTGDPLEYYYAADEVILPITLQTPNEFKIPLLGCTVKGVDRLYLFGVHGHPFERIKMMGRLANQEWSIEYLAAHLDAARNQKDTFVPWPPYVSQTDKESEDALRLMVTYHRNVDNLAGWDAPESSAYGAATQVIEWMPEVVELLYPQSAQSR